MVGAIVLLPALVRMLMVRNRDRKETAPEPAAAET